MTRPKLLTILNNSLVILIFGIIPNLSLIQDPIQFNYPKILLIYLISVLILGFFILIFLQRKTQKFEITSSQILILAFLLLFVISTINSQSLILSIFGDWFAPSKQGLITYLCLLLFFFYFRYQASFEILPKILFVAVLGGCYIFLWGVMNQSGLDYYQLFPIRMSSLEQNTIDFSSYQTLVLPAALILFLAAGKIQHKILSFLGLLLISGSIILSLTRGAWISAVLTISIISVLLWRWEYFQKKGLKKYFLALSLMLVTALIYFFPLIKARFAETFSFSIYNSPVIRSLEYQAGLKIIRDFPLLGVGPDALRVVFPKYRPLELNLNLKEWNQVVIFIRSYYLQVAATSGSLSLVTLLVFIIYIARLSLKTLKEVPEGQFFFVLGIFGVWLAISISFIFYNASLTQQLFFWSLSGFLTGLTKEKKIFLLKAPDFQKIMPWRLIIPAVLMLFWLSLILAITIDLVSKVYFIQRVNLSERDQRLETIATAIRTNPFDGSYSHKYVLEYLPKIAQIIIFRPDDKVTAQDLIYEALNKLQQARKLNPKDPQLIYDQTLLDIQTIRLAKGVEQEKLLPSVLKNAEGSLAANPTSPDVADIITLIYLAMEGKKLKEAEGAARYSIKLMPGYVIGYHHLGEALKQQGLFEEAIQAYQQAFKYDPDNQVSKDEISKTQKLMDFSH